jgi:hypothetical protein
MTPDRLSTIERESAYKLDPHWIPELIAAVHQRDIEIVRLRRIILSNCMQVQIEALLAPEGAPE